MFGHPPKRVPPRNFVPKLGMAIPENLGMLETGNIVYNTLDEKMHRLRVLEFALITCFWQCNLLENNFLGTGVGSSGIPRIYPLVN